MHNSALWCGRLCSQESREDHQSRYLTLPAASRCEFPRIFLLVNFPLCTPSACGDHGSLGGEPTLSPCSFTNAHSCHQPVLFMKYKCPTRDLAMDMPQRWQEVIYSSGGLFYANISLQFPWKLQVFGAACWPNLCVEDAGSPRGPSLPQES